ncbi:MAG TPA: TetR/AcrR family transcriptional regulator [Gemmatimonadota bacterium]|nr:TetR/AcrR family transcriptional regulator [Gemmatimonadota bacterium]
MSARPRKVSDEEVLGAVLRVMHRVAPAQVTLTEIASEAGVTPSALVQRFGSKRELLLEMIRRAAEGTAEYFAHIRRESASPLAALHAYAECFAEMAESPETLAHHLGYLQLDLTDPDFRKHARDQARAADGAIRDLLDDAVAEGELAHGTDLDMLMRSVIAVLGGSLLAWAIRQRGTAAKWIRADLDAVLRPHLSRKRGSSAGS